MANDLRIAQNYSNMVYAVFTDIKASAAMKKFKETTESLIALGYTREEIGDILKSILTGN